MNTELKTRQEIFTALAQGKVVQWKFSYKEGPWETFSDPVGQIIPGYDWRVKPEPEPCPGEVAEAMRKFGGGFMSALGLAVHHADEDNLQRIKTAFAEDWQKYSEVAKRTMEKEVEKEIKQGWWCNTHNRFTTFQEPDGKYKCHPSLPGIMMVCKCVLIDLDQKS